MHYIDHRGCISTWKNRRWSGLASQRLSSEADVEVKVVKEKLVRTQGTVAYKDSIVPTANPVLHYLRLNARQCSWVEVETDEVGLE